MKISELKNILKERHMTQQQLADYLNVHISTINGWIKRDKCEIDLKNLIKISNLLNVSVNKLLGINSKEIVISEEDYQTLTDCQNTLEKILDKYKN